MINQYINSIKNSSVKYYENNWLTPDFQEHITADSILDYCGYYYSFAVKLMQNNFYKTRDEAEQSIYRLLEMTENSLDGNVKQDTINNYNYVYSYLIERFKSGLDYGEDSPEGFKIMLDASAKIICSSVYWLENN